MYSLDWLAINTIQVTPQVLVQKKVRIILQSTNYSTYSIAPAKTSYVLS